MLKSWYIFLLSHCGGGEFRHLYPPLLSNLEVSLFLTWTNLLAVGKIPLPDLLLLLLSYSGLGSRNVREFACV